ncbi:hypothetical protein DAPPUDRAFT_125602, partial [Daphnia pulex]
ADGSAPQSVRARWREEPRDARAGDLDGARRARLDRATRRRRGDPTAERLPRLLAAEAPVRAAHWRSYAPLPHHRRPPRAPRLDAHEGGGALARALRPRAVCPRRAAVRIRRGARRPDDARLAARRLHGARARVARRERGARGRASAPRSRRGRSKPADAPPRGARTARRGPRDGLGLRASQRAAFGRAPSSRNIGRGTGRVSRVAASSLERLLHRSSSSSRPDAVERRGPRGFGVAVCACCRLASPSCAFPAVASTSTTSPSMREIRSWHMRGSTSPRRARTSSGSSRRSSTSTRA